MFFDMNLAFFFGAFMTWGFLIAFLFNVFGKVVGFKDSNSIIITALIVFMSYFASDHFVEFSRTTDVYLEWLQQDVWTVVSILIAHVVFKIKHHFTTGYVYLGLTINGLLFTCMWLDVQYFENQEPWWFWSFYSLGINVIDYAMIITLIVGKDWLGLARLGRAIKQKVIEKKNEIVGYPPESYPQGPKLDSENLDKEQDEDKSKEHSRVA